MKTSCLIAVYAAMIAFGTAIAASGFAVAEEKDDGTFTLAEGKVKFTAPAGWVRTKPLFGIVDHEFAVPAAEGDKAAGRFTATAATGSVQDNLDRWVAQFTQPDRVPSGERTVIKMIKVGGHDVHTIDIRGTYDDRAKRAKFDDYRMLAAIVPTKSPVSFFLKFYGPKATVAANEKAFMELVNSMEMK
jgi:hypothetical protein